MCLLTLPPGRVIMNISTLNLQLFRYLDELLLNTTLIIDICRECEVVIQTIQHSTLWQYIDVTTSLTVADKTHLKTNLTIDIW